MKLKTRKKQKYISQTLERTMKSYRGAAKILSLVARAEGSENVSSVIANPTAVMLLQQFKQNF